jgi:hypothetical protein
VKGFSRINPGGLDSARIAIADGQVIVENLAIPNQVIVDYLQAKPEEEWPNSFIEAAEVGIFCLERANATRDLDFVRQQIQQQVALVIGELGKIPANLQVELLKKIGNQDGQVLAPISALINTTDKVLRDKLALMQNLLDGQLAPRRTDTTLGNALASISGLLDSNREDSIQKVLEKAVESISKADGALALAVKTVLDSQLKPIQEELIRLGHQISGQAATENALSETTAKGTAFEKDLLPGVQCWAKFVGGRVEHVGGDNQAGDIVVSVSEFSTFSDSFTIVIQARDEKTPRGHKQISDEVAKALARRAGHFGIYVSKTPTGLAREIGDCLKATLATGPTLHALRKT